MKTCGLYLIAGILSFGSLAFAQGHGGISGPDVVFKKEVVVDSALTRATFNQVFVYCINNEALRLQRIIAKSNALQIIHGSAPTEDAKEVSSQQYNFTFYATVINEHGGGFPIMLSFNNYYHTDTIPLDPRLNTLNGSFFLDDPAKAFEAIVHGVPLMVREEQAGPDSYDEYGRVIPSKVMIRKATWVGIDEGRQLQLFNNVTDSPIQGVYFDQPAFMNCVNSRISVQHAR